MSVSKTIGILLQGRISEWTQDIVTEYKKNFPNSEILVSTWEGENTNDLTCNVVKSKPPPTIKNDVSTANFQIVGCQEGLKNLKTDIILKSRTDQFIHNPKIFEIFENYCSSEKIIMAIKISLYTSAGTKKGQVALPEKMFDAPVRVSLMHQALVRQQANKRYNIAYTKGKGEVSGGGRKPYRQKGTGNARQGSTRNPHYIGGSVAHGPRGERNFEKNMPKKQRRAALFSALTVKRKEDGIFALEEYTEKEMKTKMVADMIQKLPGERNYLLVLAEHHPVLERSTRNLPHVKTLLVSYLNIADLQKYHHVIFLADAIKKAEEVFLSSQK